ncbi:MAG: hypothetical protein AAFZ80_05730 [Cyanobacteria bacterium P01_A01_bin.105]
MLPEPSDQNGISQDWTEDVSKTEADTLTLRYRVTLGWGLVVLGLINLGLGIWLLLLGDLVSGGILGILFLIAGYLYLKRPYFEVRPNRVTVYNLLGNVVKRYPLTPNERLTVQGRKLLIEQDGMARKVAVSRFLIKDADWEALESRLVQP